MQSEISCEVFSIINWVIFPVTITVSYLFVS